MYGMIPNANTEACENAPPVNTLINHPIPSSVWFVRFVNLVASIPGRVNCAPKPYTNNNPIVNKLRFFNSSIFQTLMNESINFFILLKDYKVTASPPAASIAAFADAVNL